LAAEGVSKVDGILLDLGLGSHQLLSEERGFSIDGGGPLDMRYDPDVGISAKEAVNRLPQRELERIFRELGEERRARSVARAIVNAREKGEIKDAGELSRIVTRAVTAGSGGWKKIHPATRVFMALRIYVNGELENLEEFLQAVPTVLKEGGVIVVISFHSLEDRIVKTAFRRLSGKGDAGGKYWPGPGPEPEGRPEEPVLAILTKKPIIPTPEEVRENRRARSAKLRAARRI
jgi:16S rRNA (cytosine1402-N4)-methyltransferase